MIMNSCQQAIEFAQMFRKSENLQEELQKLHNACIGKFTIHVPVERTYICECECHKKKELSC